MTRFLVSLVPIGVLLAVWNAPGLDTWQFWVGAAMLGVLSAIDSPYR